MAQILGFETGINIPAAISSGMGGTFTIILIIIVLGLSAAGIIWYWRDRTLYNRKIVLFENIAGQGYQVTFKDRARLVKIGDGGEELLRLKKKKVFRTAYGKKMAKNEYWFAVGQDGYWYNILLGDLDAKMGMLDIEPVDRDMRYMHVAIRKNITERYRKQGFMEKYGVFMFSTLFMIIMIVGFWILIDQIGELMGSATAVVQTSQDVIKPLESIISKLDSICAGGSGLSGG